MLFRSQERLTKTGGLCASYIQDCGECTECDHCANVFEKLAAYEGALTLEEAQEYAKAKAEGRVVIRPACEKCRHRAKHNSENPCYVCYGQNIYWEKGFHFEPIGEAAERALTERSKPDGKC